MRLEGNCFLGYSITLLISRNVEETILIRRQSGYYRYKITHNKSILYGTNSNLYSGQPITKIGIGC